MFQNNLLMAADAASGTSLVSVENSALYVDGNSEFLVRTLTGAGTSRKTFTLGGWFYKTKVGSGSDCRIFQWDNGTTNTDRGMILIDNTTPDAIKLLIEDASDVATMIWTTTQLIRDQAWYHWCLTVDTTPSIPVFKFFLNNEEITAWTKGTDTIAQDDVFTIVDSGARQAWGSAPEGTGYFDGYMAECFLLDGQVVTDATDFVDVSADGLYVTPKSNTAMKALTFGDEGFYLDNVTNAQTDASGNGNNFTNTNTVTASTHTPTNSSALLTPLYATNGNVAYSNGNRTIAANGAVNEMTCATLAIPPNSGKWYFDVSWDTWADAYDDGYIGIALGSLIRAGMSNPTTESNSWNIYMTDPIQIILGDGSNINTTQAFSQIGDIFQVAYDSDTGKLFLGYYDASATAEKWFSGDGTATAGDPSAGTDPTVTLSVADRALPLFPFAGIAGNSGQKFTVNFEEDEFARTAPTGFKALNTTNIAAETTRTASDTTKYFDTILYEGNGAGQRVGQFQPFGNAFTVGNGALFLEENAEHFTRTPAGAGSLVTWTISTWVKRGKLGISCYFIGTNDGGKNMTFGFGAANNLYWQLGTGDSWNGPNTVHMKLQTTQLYEDPSQWMHVVLKYDSTASTPSASGIALYVDGVQIENLAAEVYPAQNYASGWNSANEMLIGAIYNTETDEQNMDGYLAETVFIDGLALTPTSFGQTDTSTNRWIPKSVTGLTYGTNGFYLDYSNASDLGEDQAGSNDWTNVNTVVQVTDSPTTNLSVLNPSDSTGGTISIGNTKVVGITGWDETRTTIPVYSGKWYWEVVADTVATSSWATGILEANKPLSSGDSWWNSPARVAGSADPYGYEQSNKRVSTVDATGLFAAYGNAGAISAGDVIGVALDLDNGAIWFSKADSWIDGDGTDSSATVKTEIEAGTTSSSAFASLSGAFNPAISTNSTSVSGTYRFASGDWTGSAPTGFSALTQDALTSSDQFISAFSWIKNRDSTDEHMLFDRIRGVTNDLHIGSANQVTNVETLQSFLAGGVQVGNDVQVNTANESYVLWNFMMEATGSGASNEDGSINTVATLVDTTLGLSMSQFVGTGANATVGHGLGVVPEMVFVKGMDGGNHWYVYHIDRGTGYTFYWNGNSGGASTSTVWNNTAPTSSVFSLGTDTAVNGSSVNFVAYCFAPSQFTSFSSYEGNGNANGSFIPTLNSLGVPIQPVWAMMKSMDSTSDWYIYDNKRLGYNVENAQLWANLTTAEATADNLDIVTGGLKMRIATDPNVAETYVYMAIGTPIIDTDGRIIAGR